MACSALMCYRGVVFVHKFANFESKDNSALTTPTVRDKWRGLALGVGIVGDTPVQGDSAKRASLRFFVIAFPNCISLLLLQIPLLSAGRCPTH